MALGGYEVMPTGDITVIEATLNRAERALRYGLIKDAHTVFCKAVGLAPDNFRASLGLAQLLLIRRDAKASAYWAEHATSLESEYPRRAKNALADALVRLGRIDEARILWLEAAPIPNPTPKQLYDYMRKTQSLAAAALGDHAYHRAERLYRRIVVLEPDNTIARRQLAKTLLKQRLYEAAKFWMSQDS
jgi:tetratricopeptide (TPR) repeat protein